MLFQQDNLNTIQHDTIRSMEDMGCGRGPRPSGGTPPELVMEDDEEGLDEGERRVATEEEEEETPPTTPLETPTECPPLQ